MLRHLLPTLFFVFVLDLGHYAHAALSPEAQQEQEENAIRESKGLSGSLIRDITMYEENGTRYYEVEADCIYKFVVNYPLNLFERLFGIPGPKEFNVAMKGEANCQDSVLAERNQGGLETTILEYISDIYDVPMFGVGPMMNLYHIPTDQEKLSLDFRIMVLRERLDKLANCRIATDLFMTIRKVSDLLKLANKHCGLSK